MKQLNDIIAAYQQTIQETESKLQNARKHIRNISLLRIIIFVEVVVCSILFWSDGWLKLALFTVIPIIGFIWLVQIHNQWFYWKDYYKRKIEINKQEIRALQYDFSDFENGEEFIDPAHLTHTTWIYLAITPCFNISTAPLPRSANSVLPTGLTLIWRKKTR